MPRVPRLKHHPRLLPRERWARIALVLLVLFTLVRGVLWASTQPGWFAPDEDYHWLYTEYVLIEKSWPHLDKPFATQELFNSAVAIQQGQYSPVRARFIEGARGAASTSSSARRDCARRSRGTSASGPSSAALPPRSSARRQSRDLGARTDAAHRDSVLQRVPRSADGLPGLAACGAGTRQSPGSSWRWRPSSPRSQCWPSRAEP